MGVRIQCEAKQKYDNVPSTESLRSIFQFLQLEVGEARAGQQTKCELFLDGGINADFLVPSTSL